MQKKLIVYSLCIVAINASAQVADQTSTVPQPKKNEVYVNLVPILKVLVGDNSDNNRFSITYKRSINEKSALRFSALFNVINSYYFSSNGTVYPWIFSGVDTTKYINEGRSSRFIKPQGNIGYERIFGKHKLKWFYGSDLLFGYSEKQSHYQYYIYYKDISIPSAGYIRSENFNVSSKVKTYSIGISPFFGAKYPISKRFLVSTQLTFDFAWQRQIVSEVEGSNSKTITNSLSETNIYIPFFHDVSVIYLF